MLVVVAVAPHLEPLEPVEQEVEVLDQYRVMLLLELLI
tara:strand:+ start:297 stop:410 length:114 start_codon:yes stop_codon:yes gene_type:complete